MPENLPPALVGLTLTIDTLAIETRIGVPDAERRRPQRLLVDLAVEVSAHQPERDSVEEVVDYGAIAQRVRDLAGGERRLLETLAREIAAAAFVDPAVRAVEVVLRKPDIFQDCAAVGIRARYRRDSHDIG